MYRLEKAIAELKEWQVLNRRNSKHRCLEAVRYALGRSGLKLPDIPGVIDLAVNNGLVLLDDPNKFGWKQVHSPLESPCLVYFKGCGKLKDGRAAGHVAILDPEAGKHYANFTGKWSKWWADRILGAFVPKEG